MRKAIICTVLSISVISCTENTEGIEDLSSNQELTEEDNTESGNEERILLGGAIDLDALVNYSNQPIPEYITKDNTRANSISNIEATLGRVLFYDKMLSVDKTISCATCHKQEFAFGDQAIQSQGINGLTVRHSMRLVNTRFSEESNFFWDERANSLEEQTTMPIKDHIEMGFSGEEGALSFEELCQRLSGLEYYKKLFVEAFGDTIISEQRIQNSLAQFIRSIQSFDSKFDEGRRQTMNENMDFLNFTDQENRGKRLFIQAPQFLGQSGNRIGGGLGCNGCHNSPEFDIDPNSRNNGVIDMAGSEPGLELNVTRSPSLRDMFSIDGQLNTPLMHTGDFFTIEEVLGHYNQISREAGNNNLDQRLARGGGIKLNITTQERSDLISFLKTLTGRDIYTAEKWSDPFL